MDKLLKYAIVCLSLGVLLLLIGTGGSDYFRTYDLSNDTEKLQKKLDEIDNAFNEVANDTAVLNDIIVNGFASTNFNSLSKLPFGYLVYKDNQLHFWNKNNIVPPTNISLTLPDGNSASKFLNGYYYVNKKTIFKGKHGYSLLGVYLLKNNFKTQNKYLQNELNSELELPKFLAISFDSMTLANSFKSDDGRTIFYLGKDVFEFNNTPNPLLIKIFLAGGILVLIAIAMFTYYILLVFGFGYSFLFLLLSLFAVRFLGIFFNFPFEISKLEIFNPVYFASSAFNKSLADLLLNIFTVFSLAYFYFRYAPDFALKKIITQYHKAFLFFFYSAALMCSYAMGELFKSLLTNSNIPFNLNNFLDLNVYSVLGIIALAATLLSYAIVILKTVLIIAANNKKYINYPLLAIATAIHIAFLFWQQEDLIFYAGVIWTIVFLIFLNDFRKQYTTGFPFTSLMMVITFFAVFSAIHIYKNNNETEEKRKLSFARNIAQSDDPVTEYLFMDIQQKIMNDKTVRTYFSKPFISQKDIIERLKNYYFEGYLSKYEVKIFLLNSEGSMLQSDDKDILNLLNNELLENARETGTENLFFIPRNNGSYCYLSNIAITDVNRFVGSIVIVLNPKVFYKSNLYPELLLEDHIKPTGRYESFSFAEYAGDRLLNKSGSYPYNFKFDITDSLSGDYTILKESNLQHIVYEGEDGKKVVVTSAEKTFIQPITLFSYLFVIYLIFAIAIVLLRIVKRLLDGSLKLKSLFDISLKNRIQLAMIMMIVISFISVGVVTIYHFINKYNDNQKQRMLRREESVRTDISYAIADNPNLLLKRNFNTFEFTEEKGVLNLSVLSEIHGIDINIFNVNGELMNTSQPDIFEKGLFSTVMDPTSLRYLLYRSKIQYFQNESIGKLQFLSLYAPLRNREGELLAYLNLPYFAIEKELKSEISSFLVTLINVYVLLLVFGGFLAYVLSDSITRSLSVLSDRFRSIRLGMKNEPIEWKSNDEIGVLVAKYNEMINELEASADMLAKSERELAWREMAKQIAHEIKNPLTPMKLSIQMLQKAMREGRADVPQLSERVTKTLIEQIDNLSQIATAFSSFAKMPQANLETLNLEETIQSAVNLVSPHDDFEITFNKTEKNILVNADKNQLLRAFGNLIKNAQQAIPDNHKGKMTIDVSLAEQNVTIQFKDNGTGIPEEIQPRVFNPNFTTKTSGMGLGLAITKQAIEEGAKGKIWFETKANEGTTFFVKLPLA